MTEYNPSQDVAQAKKLTPFTHEHVLFLSGLIHILESQFRWDDGARQMRAYRAKLLNSGGQS